MTSAAATGTTAAARPPLWLVMATSAMAVALLAMSITETSFKGQYLIDEGEYLSLGGLAFILVAGLWLHRQRRLAPSLPLVFPWLLYPIITQGDQIIDNLSITWMRIIVHVLLAAIFGTPVLIVALTARWLLALTPREVTYLTAALLALEIVLAYLFLGTLMIATLILMIAVVLYLGTRRRPANETRDRREQAGVALWVLVVGVAVSGALYLGFKNRPGAYQGSPSFYMDPAQAASRFDVSAVAVPAGTVTAPPDGEATRAALSTYADSLQRLLDGYYVLDRNYNYHFHNELFLQATPLLPDYRAVGLQMIADAAAKRLEADALAARIPAPADTAIGALVADVRGYAAFSFARAATIERMTAEFERTKAGLQHATHIYEGEGKYLGVQLAALLDKYRAVLNDPAVAPLVADFVARSRAIHDRYANRIVGF